MKMKQYDLKIMERVSMLGLVNAISQGSRDQFRSLDLAKGALSLTKFEMDNLNITITPEGQLYVPASAGDYTKTVELTPLAEKTMIDILKRLEKEGHLERRFIEAYDVFFGKQVIPEPAPETGKDTGIKFLDEEKPPPPAE